MKEFRFKKVSEDAKISMPVYSGDAGYDVCAIESVLIPAKESKEVRTGIAIEVPEEYFVLVRTRSGHGVKRDIQLHHGLIDAGYRNEITVRVYNHSSMNQYIQKGEKICQLVILPRTILPLVEVKELSETDRGMNGLGSTGK